VNAGVYVFTESIFDALDGTESQDSELHLTDAIQNLPGRVAAGRPDGIWFDPTYPWDALRAMSHLLSVHSALVVDEAIDESATVHDSAMIERPALVGPGCEVGAGAVVRAGSCLRENVRIGPNATVERSIVDTGATVGANAVIRDTILGPGVHVGSGTVSSGGQRRSSSTAASTPTDDSAPSSPIARRSAERHGHSRNAYRALRDRRARGNS